MAIGSIISCLFKLWIIIDSLKHKGVFSDDVVNYTNWYTGSPRFPSKTSYAVLTQFCVDLILKIVYFVLYEEITYQHKIKYILNGELVTAWVDIKYKYLGLYLLCETSKRDFQFNSDNLANKVLCVNQFNRPPF